MSSHRAHSLRRFQSRYLGTWLQLDPVWAFGLMARLWSKEPGIDAFRVMTTYQGIEMVPNALAVCTGLGLGLCPLASPGSIFLGVVSGGLLGLLLVRFGGVRLARSFGLLAIGCVLGSVPTVFVYLGIGFLFWGLRGWQAPLFWVGGIATYCILEAAIEAYLTRRRIIKWGAPISASGANFLHAYRFYAKRLKVTPDINLTDEEVDAGCWINCLRDYAQKHPRAAINYPGLPELERSQNISAWRAATPEIMDVISQAVEQEERLRAK